MASDSKYAKTSVTGPYTKNLRVVRGRNNKFGGMVYVDYHDRRTGQTHTIYHKEYKTYKGAKNNYAKLPGGQIGLDELAKKKRKNPKIRKGGRWSQAVTKKESYHTPPGLFEKKASTIANTLMRGAKGDATKAMRRLTFYMNRAGKNLTNKRELGKAKTLLKKKAAK